MSISLEILESILIGFEKQFADYTYKTYPINKKEKVFVIEDALVLYAGFLTYAEYWSGLCWTEYKKGEEYYFKIEELTYNDINFKIDTDKFNQKCIEQTGKSITVSYDKFFRKEARCLDWQTHKMLIQKRLVEPIGSYIPQLKLFERIKQWQGIKYNFVIIEIPFLKGGIGHGVFRTTRQPYRFVYSKCREWLKYGFHYGGTEAIIVGLESAFLSWRGKKIKKINLFEQYLTYFYIEEYVKNKNDIWEILNIISNMYNEKLYDNYPRNRFIKTNNKWKTEELVYKYVKKLYKDYNVIYQYRPFFLRSEKGGQMSYDVFIAKLNIAIEYQGKQHFEPIDYFGGEANFKETQKRDKLKKELSKKKCVKLVYINYWENITEDLIKGKIEKTLNN